MKIIPLLILLFVLMPTVLGTVYVNNIQEVNDYIRTRDVPPVVSIEDNVTPKGWHYATTRDGQVAGSVFCVDFQVVVNDPQSYYKESNTQVLDVLFNPAFESFTPAESRLDISLKLESGWDFNERQWCVFHEDIPTDISQIRPLYIQSVNIVGGTMFDILDDSVPFDWDIRIRPSSSLDITDEVYDPVTEQWVPKQDVIG